MPETPLLQRLRLVRDLAAGGGSRAWARYAAMSWEDAQGLVERPERYVAMTFHLPPEIPAALGLVPNPHEPLAGAAASLPAARELLAQAAGELPGQTAVCGYQRLFWGLLASGWLPPPVAFAASTFACDDVWKMYEAAAARWGRPFLGLDAPAVAGPGGRALVVEGLRAVAEGLAALTGTSLTDEGVARAVRLSNRALAAKLRVDRARRLRPEALESALALRYFTLYAKMGTPAAAEVLEALAEEAEGRAAGAAGAGAAGAGADAAAGAAADRRLLWLGLVPLHRPAFTAELERRYRVTVVYEELSWFAWRRLREHHFFDDLACRVLALHYLGRASRRAEAALALARRFRADGVVHFSYAGCRTLPPGAGFIAAACRAAGLPFCEVWGDVADPAAYDAARVESQLQAFMEMIGAARR